GAAFAAAPEKAAELYSRVKHIKLNLVYEPHAEAGRFEFSASLKSDVINVHQGALELLWAASFAFPMLFEICRDSQWNGRDGVSAVECPEWQAAFRVYGWAMNKCIRGECEPWPEASPTPINDDMQ